MDFEINPCGTPRGSLGRRTVCGRTEQGRPHGVRSVAKQRLERMVYIGIGIGIVHCTVLLILYIYMYGWWRGGGSFCSSYCLLLYSITILSPWSITQTRATYGGLCGMPACEQAVGCGVCDTPELWCGAAGLCARVRACAGAAESLHTYIHLYYTILLLCSSGSAALETKKYKYNYIKHHACA